MPGKRDPEVETRKTLIRQWDEVAEVYDSGLKVALEGDFEKAASLFNEGIALRKRIKKSVGRLNDMR